MYVYVYAELTYDVGHGLPSAVVLLRLASVGFVGELLHLAGGGGRRLVHGGGGDGGRLVVLRHLQLQLRPLIVGLFHDRRLLSCAGIEDDDDDDDGQATAAAAAAKCSQLQLMDGWIC